MAILPKTVFWDIISDILGWSYFVVWSFSFYPQALLNYRRQSVRGLSIDYLFYNALGFLYYSIYNCAFYFNEEIREEYKQRHGLSDNLVRLNDVVFSVHALFMTLFILFQTTIYKKHDNQRISSFAASFVWLSLIGIVLFVSAIHYGGVMWIDLLYYLSSVKLIISFIKYLPQVWLNYKRKSTHGWSIQYILWDLSGGLLSILQLLLDAYIIDDWSGITGDNVKIGLGAIVITYDLVFLLQHFVWYKPKEHTMVAPIDQERRRLIAEGRIPIEEDEGASSSHYGAV
ncbi:PQ-loop-domain-containing protein [Backusella circina FSU 941]|nr:PQ-loop-domain-containing protein [Backusella circina FSU 941]